MMQKTSLIDYTALPWLNIFNQTIGQSRELPLVLASYGLNQASLSELAENSLNLNEAYGRKILFKNEQIEVMLASWSDHATAAPHNHGASKGLIWFVQGNFAEQHYRFHHHELTHVTQAVKFSENEVVTVDASDIHSCQPEKTGLSLHIYSPPIHEMKVWDAKRRRTLTVSDNCGAWVPQDLNLILSETPW